MHIQRKENPDFLNDYITHITVVKGLAQSTIAVYYQDIRQFLRFYVLDQTGTPTPEALDSTDIRSLTIEDIRKITLRDIHNYYSFIAGECGNKDKIRVRKATSLRSFFRYLTKQAALLDSTRKVSVTLNCTKPGYTFELFKVASLTTTSGDSNETAYVPLFDSIATEVKSGVTKDILH